MKRLVLKRLVLALAAPLLAVLLAFPAAAQDWPARQPVKIIAPFGPGSTPDLVARQIADYFQTKFGHSFIVENRPGAGGNRGTDAVAKAEPDGYTLGVSIGGPLGVNAVLFGNLPYDPAKDFALVSLLVTQPSALGVNTALGVNSVAELVALLKKNPDKYNYGSIGNGSLSQLAMEAIGLASGTELQHVPYNSSPAAVTALIQNDVQVACLPAISLTTLAGVKPIKILAVSTAKRSPFLPDVPTLKESGIDVEAEAWNGLIAPAGTPQPIVDKLRAAVAEALAVPAIREKLATQLMEPIPGDAAQFRARIDADLARWTRVIREADIKVN
ncbi:Bug family tripartite tricarboxylate transporter substrate binding protein [Aquabacter spiritensis]|uniref:Tripartite-type tricarboxylate transporter receptor subunit TctC n=1 Tax=Aquabacter spiritensis TaxID=933073 RepID=A0A4R3M6A8_9HYPH|nr:tripartite tricarboxylate transporter substrate binding protein [Aquabacter spiritensis]TCT07799.1 tripartite-type tricarboxylate transporter receptor subunit TctC [Aquabacter spiritensis]